MSEEQSQSSSRRKITPKAGSNKGQPDGQSERSKITTVPSDEEVREQGFDPNYVKQKLRRSFLITLIAGAVLILTPMKFLPFEGILKILASVFLMFIYYLAGIRHVRGSSTRAVFADSLYFLGFLFTFIALLGAMSALNELNVQSIIGQMGPALATTVFGMVARIYLTQFEPITSEPEAEVISTMSDLSAQLITTVKSLEKAQAISTRKIEEFSQNLSQIDLLSLQDEFRKLAEAVNSLASSTRELKSSGDRAKTDVDEARLKFNTLDESINSTQRKLDDFKVLSAEIDKLNSNVENAASTFSGVGEKLEAEVSSSATHAAKSIAEAAREAEKAGDEAKKLTDTLQHTVNEVAEFFNRQK